MKTIKDKFYTALVLLSCGLIILVLFVGLTRHTEPQSIDDPTSTVTPDVYHINERTTADFEPVIVEKFNEVSQLHVYTANAVQSVNLQQPGLLNWPVFSKTQRLTYKGSGSFYINMEYLTKRNISIDNQKQVIVIEIPHAQLAPIEIDPDKFEATDTQNGLLSFGDLKFTAKEYNTLEQEVKSNITAAIDTAYNHQKADNAAKEEIRKIYDPIVKSIDSGYSVEVQFIK